MGTEDANLERLVRAIDKVYDSNRHLMFRSFLSGVFTALGATIGVALVLLFLGWILTFLGGLPFIGRNISQFNDYLQSLR